MLKRSMVFGMVALAMWFLTPLHASAENRWVTIHNNTGYDMITFHGSHRDAPDWEEDILGSGILRAGQSVNINFDDGTGYCIFDFRAKFEDGDILVKKNVNICQIADFYYN